MKYSRGKNPIRITWPTPPDGADEAVDWMEEKTKELGKGEQRGLFMIRKSHDDHLTALANPEAPPTGKVKLEASHNGIRDVKPVVSDNS